MQQYIAHYSKSEGLYIKQKCKY